jgi:hypothetical protein
MTVSVPCKKYVHHYYTHKYGVPIDAPIYQLEYNTTTPVVHFPRASAERHAFLSSLCKDFHSPRPIPPIAPVYNHTMQIGIRKDDVSKFGHTVNPRRHSGLNALLEHLIKNEAYCIITTYRADGQSWGDAIRHYQTEQGFTEDIYPFDSIEKAYERFVKNIFPTYVGKPILP